MKNLEWTYVDRTKCTDPRLLKEPDKAQWTDPETRYPCLVRRGGMKAWCGYVGIPRTHPYFKKHYDEIPVDAHGGLTFSDHCAKEEGEEHICHIVEDGEDDFVWWVGFDCGHSGDAKPFFGDPEDQYMRSFREGYHNNVYRTYEYAKEETTKLAKQLKDLS